ncbi:MAG: LPS assembly lipoprotein LptE [Pseudomonadota bacterium]
MKLRLQFQTMQHLLLLLTISSLTACGFQLRGAQLSGFTASNIYVEQERAARLSEQVKLQLEGAGVKLMENPQDASYVISLKNENFERSVLSVSAATGKVEEYLITYTASMDASERGGEQLVSNDVIKLSRDYAFDEGAVLGTFSEETVIREDLVFRASSQVLRRLQALIVGQQ